MMVWNVNALLECVTLTQMKLHIANDFFFKKCAMSTIINIYPIKMVKPKLPLLNLNILSKPNILQNVHMDRIIKLHPTIAPIPVQSKIYSHVAQTTTTSTKF